MFICFNFSVAVFFWLFVCVDSYEHVVWQLFLIYIFLFFHNFLNFFAGFFISFISYKIFHHVFSTNLQMIILPLQKMLVLLSSAKHQLSSIVQLHYNQQISQYILPQLLLLTANQNIQMISQLRITITRLWETALHN